MREIRSVAKERRQKEQEEHLTEKEAGSALMELRWVRTARRLVVEIRSAATAHRQMEQVLRQMAKEVGLAELRPKEFRMVDLVEAWTRTKLLVSSADQR